MGKRAGALGALVCALLTLGANATAGPSGCGRAVVFTVPGVTWAAVDDVRPPAILDLAERGAVGSLSVRTVSSRTSFASGFATIGAGTRVDGGVTTGGVASEVSESVDLLATDVKAGGLNELKELAEEDAYGAVPGGLARALDDVPSIAVGNSDASINTSPLGFGRYSLLATMDASGVTDRAAVGTDLLVPDGDAPFGIRTDTDAIERAVDQALEEPCSFVVIDQGDLVRAELLEAVTGREQEAAHADALLAADDLLSHVVERLDEQDRLIVLAPTSPMNSEAVHFGIVVDDGYGPGDQLTSASTRRPGIVTLPDIAPTILEFHGKPRPGTMQGRAMVGAPSAPADRIAAAIELDQESSFTDGIRAEFVAVYVIFQIVVYLLIYLVLRRKPTEPVPSRTFGVLQFATLTVVAFPSATYLGGIIAAHELGPWGYGLILIAIDLAIVTVTVLVTRRALDRLLVLTASTVALLYVDLITGSNLQLNTVLSYSPLVAGRFAGIGNIAFSVLTGAVVVTGTLILHRYGATRWPIAAVVTLFVATVVMDGAPSYGSDVGGVIALVPGLAVTLMLLLGKTPNWKFVGLAVLAMVIALGGFLAVDLARPEAERTHLARLFEDVRAEGPQVFADVIVRKLRSNFSGFQTSIWTYLIPPVLAVIAWLVLRPRGRWRVLAADYPRLQAGLLAGFILGVLGFAVNDSGLVVPAVILAFLVPMALIIHLELRAAEVPAS